MPGVGALALTDESVGEGVAARSCVGGAAFGFASGARGGGAAATGAEGAASVSGAPALSGAWDGVAAERMRPADGDACADGVDAGAAAEDSATIGADGRVA